MRTAFPRIIPLLFFCLIFLYSEDVQAQSCPTGGSCDRDEDGYLKDNPKCKKEFPSCALIDCNDGDAAVQDCSSGGGETGPGYYARLDLCEDPWPSCESHVVSDGHYGMDVVNNTYHQYWDSEDPEMIGISPHTKCDLSSGGRLKCEHPYGPDVRDVDRWISIHWERTECPNDERMTPILQGNCPNLYSLLYQDVDPNAQKLPPEADACVDNLHFNIRADRLFKSGATRQQFEIIFDKDRFSEERTRYSLFWYDYLYIEQLDENHAVLTTSDGSGQHHSIAKLMDLGEATGKQDDVLLGCFDVKFRLDAVKGPAGYN